MISRRTFLACGACTAVALGSAPRFLFRAAAAAQSRSKILVAVFQRGAVDGLSMVVPYGDAAYYAARSTIAIEQPRGGDAERALDLDGFFALHPAMSALAPLWRDRALAIVHACGSPDTTRSHFDAQDYMESGTPGVKSTADGWLARAAAVLGEPQSPFRAVALGPRLPRSLRGEAGAISMSALGRFGVRGPAEARDAGKGFESLYAQAVDDLLRGTGTETFEAVKTLERAGAARLVPANGAVYPPGRLGESLRQISALIRSDVGLRIAFADMEGWDTHVGQGNAQGQLAQRLREFAGALAAFAQDLGDRMGDVAVLTMSEFGRTVRENGNRGTDHGHATAMLVLGGGVRGGTVYGHWPGLAPEQLFEGRDLAVTTDFRALFSEVAIPHLGLPASAALFPGWRHSAPPLGITA